MAVETKIVWNGDKTKTKMNTAMVAGLIRSANFVQNDAKSLVPVISGDLKTSIVEGKVDKNLLSIKVSTNLAYSAAIEFGYKGKRPQPYLKPALDMNEERIKKAFMEEGAKVTK